MTVPAQFPNFTRQKWIVFINDRAFDDFNYTIPYTDVYAGKRVTLRENTNKPNKVVLTELN